MNPRVRFDDEADAEYRYHVIYLEMATYISILALAHDHRKPGYWKGRLK